MPCSGCSALHGVNPNKKKYPFCVVVHDVELSVKQLNNDLNKISESVFQTKMALNPDLFKQAQEIVFSHKTHKMSS